MESKKDTSVKQSDRTPDTNCEDVDSSQNHLSNLSEGYKALLPTKTLKKVVSEGRYLGARSGSGHEGDLSSLHHLDINHQLLPKAVAERIKETKGSLPVTATPLANYRNFQLQKQKEAESNLLNKDISQVLVISTGGTFCMVKTPKGYMVQRGLAERLKKFHSFYDDEMAKMLDLPADTLITPETPYHKRV